jgi:Tol biopolymer transport system component
MSDFAWSPDGMQISFVLEQGAGQQQLAPDIYVMDADGTHVQQLTSSLETDIYPAWQPGT